MFVLDQGRLAYQKELLMPELPEVETWRRLAEQHVAGRKIVSVYTAADEIVFDQIPPAEFARRLKGKTVRAVHRLGKHLWMNCGKDCEPYFHFGMSGSFYVYENVSARSKWVKAELCMANGLRLAYQNKRRIGKVRLFDDAANSKPICDLGFDPYLNMLPLDAMQARLEGKRSPIKSVLLDQSFAAGVGNWIADEILYQAGIHPRVLAGELTREQIKVLRRKMKSIIDKAVAVGAEAERFPKSWLFHHRWGKNESAQTARGETVEFDRIGGRTTAWVPERQMKS